MLSWILLTFSFYKTSYYYKGQLRKFHNIRLSVMKYLWTHWTLYLIKNSLFFQILPWTGQIMQCGGLKKIFGWTKLDGPLISTISQPMLSSISHQCTKHYGYNCQIYDSSIVKLISGNFISIFSEIWLFLLD